MSIFRQSLNADVPEACRHGAVTIGNFDGVHLGHQALLAESARQAKAFGGPGVAVTLQPHPQQLLRVASFQPILTTLETRAELLQSHGADHVLILQIDRAFLELSARDFFQRLIDTGLEARALIEGFNFAFGKERQGTSAMLEILCQEANIHLTLLPALKADGRPVSTSRARAELMAGNVAAARTLLGRSYRLAGIVAEGQRRGQTLGFPTANLENIATLIPGDGVYAASALVADERHPAAVNVGPNPTFGELARKVEVHVLDFEGDLYAKSLSIDFVEKIRDTRPFPTAAALVDQLKRDVQAVKEIISP